ncbi:MAG: alpha/beta hydrolase [Acidobacteria bacterium]|nr:alpha/beta hydrolase [Acidobacteriota bacterium]NIM60325.1 alpha/beta hydrolase [Acidobacteriota bacterium]NIO60326.1 alpha/beta hydrolase [Acidobacteriota bacterium]NIQ31381.1 alpha/beta hydrolase [Acidobacteriota bacterium]NIQ86607.1 alpha/beta hydrolase [Acidobacteriota bacterium]
MEQKVLLLHGMGRTRGSLRNAARRLEALGWHTRRVGYPSLTRPIERLAEHVAEKIRGETARLHFVTHSLGGLVLRRLLHSHRPVNLGRVVMLAPPNRGSRLARRLSRVGRVVPAVRQLALSEEELARLLGPIDFELLVVAGTRGVGPLRWLDTTASDGIVTVDETFAGRFGDTFVVRRGHTFIMNSPEVLARIDQFLREGSG